MDPTHQWIVGTALGLFGALFIFFWKLYSHHSRKTDLHKKENSDAHLALHKKIDQTDDKSQSRHSLLRDKLDDVYKLLMSKKD